MDYIFVWVFIAFVALVFVGMLYDNLKCRHEWEEVVRNSVSVVYRCKKCGKEKRYTL